MGIFRSLFTPQIPSISDTVGVVEWFFSYDEKLKDAKGKIPQPHLDNLKLTIIENLRGSHSAEVLQLHIDDASTISKGSLEELYRFHTSAPEDKKVDAAAKAIVLEAASTTMLRIYGYFMLRRFNGELSITPVSDSKESSSRIVISCPSCQGQLRVPDTLGELRITCNHCMHKFLWSPG